MVTRPPEAERKQGASSSRPGFGAGTWAQAEGGDLRNEAEGEAGGPKPRLRSTRQPGQRSGASHTCGAGGG